MNKELKEKVTDQITAVMKKEGSFETTDSILVRVQPIMLAIQREVDKFVYA